MRIQEGEGWRLALDLTRQPRPVLLGGRDWASELRPEECALLARAVAILLQQHRDLAPMLMREEEIELDVELALPAAGALWVSLKGSRESWGLRFILTPGPSSDRALEGSWDSGSSAALAAALAQLARELATETDGPCPADQQC
ncbi:MAG: DUF1818 family protein [Synechococcaceae cyanobacterium]|nr:DUF1818 family protein [Synechococcaceae cyanobacterium]